MRVRLIQDGETDEVSAVWHEARKQAHTLMDIPAERDLTLDESRRIFRDIVAPGCEIWVAERRSKIVGFAALRGSYVDRMYVRPSHQRQGVGAALLEKARALSPAGLELHTHQANHPARAFYEKHEFRPVRFGVSPPPESWPDIEYWWRPA